MKNIQIIFTIFINLFAAILSAPWDYPTNNVNRNNPAWYNMPAQAPSQFQNSYGGRNVAAYPENLSVNLMPTNNSPGGRKSSPGNGYYGNSNINSQQLLTNTQDNGGRKSFSEIYFPLLAKREKLAKSLKSKNNNHDISDKKTTPKIAIRSNKNTKNFRSTTIKPISSNNIDSKYIKINRGTKIVKSSVKPQFGQWRFYSTTKKPTTITTTTPTIPTKKLDYKFYAKVIKSYYTVKPTITTEASTIVTKTTTQPILNQKWTKKSFVPRFKTTSTSTTTITEISTTTTTTTKTPTTTSVIEKSSITTAVNTPSTTSKIEIPETTKTAESTTTATTETSATSKNLIKADETLTTIIEKDATEASSTTPNSITVTLSNTTKIAPTTTTQVSSTTSTTTNLPTTTITEIQTTTNVPTIIENIMTTETVTTMPSTTTNKSLAAKIEEEASKKYQYRNEKEVIPYNFRTVEPLNSKKYKKSTSETPTSSTETIVHKTLISSLPTTSIGPSTTLEEEVLGTTEITEEQLKEALDKILPNVELLSAIKDVVSKFRQSLDNAGIQDDVRHMGNQIESTLDELKSGLNRSWFAVKQSAEDAVKLAALQKFTKNSFEEKKGEVIKETTLEEESKTDISMPNSSNMTDRQRKKIENNTLYKKIDHRNKNNKSSVIEMPQESEGELQRRLYHKLDNWLGRAQQALSDDSGRLHTSSSTTSIRNHPDSRTRFPRGVEGNTSQF